jgi:hypothetical protein
MLTTIRGIGAEEEADKSRIVIAATTDDVVAANLAGEEDPTMSLDLQGWRISDKGKWGIRISRRHR